MLASRILQLEALIFVYAIVAIVTWKVMTYSINLRGLLSDKLDPSRISPARIQLLLSTIAVALQYLQEVTTSRGDGFPPLPSGWLYLFAGSSLIYSVRKATEGYYRAKVNRQQ